MRLTRVSTPLVLVFLCVSTCASAQPLDLSRFRLVDLTHAFDERTLYWPTETSTFDLRKLSWGDANGFFYSAFALCTAEHGGTHLDAPLHFAEGRRAAADVPLEQLVAPAVVIDVEARARADRNYLLTPGDIESFERTHGRIAAGTIVLVRTGWSRFWPDRKPYLGDDTPGDASKLSFPGVGADAMRLLVEERRIAALGIDTASIDHGPSRDFAAHRIGAARNVPNFENLANLDQLPGTGAVVVALPMKIAGGSGGPLRAIAFVPR